MKYHFFATLSITELINYPDDDNDYFEGHFLIREIVSILKIDFPIKQIYERYFNDSVNTGDVLLFNSKKDSSHFILIDTFKDPYDQLDLIRIGVQITSNDIDKIRVLFRQLYDKSSIFINYHEGQGILNNLCAPTMYPKQISINNYKYEQQLKVY
ncbi:hypothetical protein [Paenibacillus polymyxa]|uniref:hypothetical protein n=1 Tax=Paenibacillus polymyxa TaxID=1406 RepID=UPI0002D5DB75|nr:hypothetical protein [Paenibacillus polymyxa]NMP11237.1 hypothetical protein [Paenibacillus polymyxa]OAZ50048.1 hypothetical protein A9Z39_08865 [Paenibacillus polymyxa]UNL93261.1 hypothetical protein CPY53_06600 [Paenibacillus polymyxa]